MAKRKRGGRRPKTDVNGHRIARYRASTRSGRMAAPDFGPPEVQRLRTILNPGQPGLPADPLSALLARNFIDERMYNSGRYFAALVAIARRGWNLRDGSVTRLYIRMVAGIVGGEAGTIPVSEHAGNGHDRSAADHARDTLERMRRELWRKGESERILVTVMVVCVDGRWTGWVKRILTRLPELPGDWRSLYDLREGLGRLVELQTSRRREAAPARELAAE
jgi:hypothetical protein